MRFGFHRPVRSPHDASATSLPQYTTGAKPSRRMKALGLPGLESRPAYFNKMSLPAAVKSPTVIW